MTVNLPPITGDDSLDTWTYEVTQDVNNAAGLGVVTDPETGAPSIDGVVLGYTQRYLDTAWGTSNTGNDFATTIGGLPAGSTMIFQGLRNTAMTVESTNPAEFTWRQVVIPTGANITTLLPWYRTVGGRQIDWLFDVIQPLGYTEDDGTAVIDLDVIAGVAVTDGISTRVDLAYAEASAATQVDIQQITATGLRSNVVSTTSGNNEFLRISLADNFNGGTLPNATFSFDPDTANSVYTANISNMGLAANASNTTALTAIGTAIAALETNITWDLLQGTTPGTAQESYIYSTGSSGTGGSAGNASLAIEMDFTDAVYPFNDNFSYYVKNRATSTGSITTETTGVAVGLNTTGLEIATGVATNGAAFFAGSDVTVSRVGSVVTFSTTSRDELVVYLSDNVGTSTNGAEAGWTSFGSFTNPPTMTAIANGNRRQILQLESPTLARTSTSFFNHATSRPYVLITPGPGTSVPNPSGTRFDNYINGVQENNWSFNNNASPNSVVGNMSQGLSNTLPTGFTFATQFVSAMNNLVIVGTNDFTFSVVARNTTSGTDFNWGPIVSDGLPVITTSVSSGVETVDNVATGQPPVEAEKILGIASSSVQITLTDDSVDETIDFADNLTTDTALRDDLLTKIQALTSITNVFTVTADTANVEGVTDAPIVKLVANNTFPHSLVTAFTANASGDLTGSASGNLVVNVPSRRFIDIDLGTTTNIMASFTITASGTGVVNTVPVLLATDGDPNTSTTGVQSSYTVTDYTSAEVTAFTSFVPLATDSDIATVLSTIETAVDTNVETPIDFMAEVNGLVTTLTAQSVGIVTGLWSFTANHNNQVTDAGDIAFGTAVRTQTGGAGFQNERYASGTFTAGTYVQATPLSTSTLSAARTVSWTTTEPVVSMTATDYEFRAFVGPRNANGFVYMASTVPPAAPTGGSINFTTGVFTPPSGWSNDAPSTTAVGEQVYVTHWTLTEDTFDGVQAVVYQTPVLAQIVVNDVKSINYDGTTMPGANDRYIDTGATQGYFLDAETGQLIATDVIAKDFDVSSENLRLGPNAGNPTMITATDVLAIGDRAAEIVTSGSSNIGIGNLAGASITSTANNVFIGNNAGMMATDASGLQSARVPWTGLGRNIGIGSISLGSTIRPDLTPITSEDNIGIGQFTLVSLTTGNSNLAMGFFTGGALTEGMDNIFVGARAGGSTTTGSGNILIGDSVEASSATASSEIKIGQGTESVASVGQYNLASLSNGTQVGSTQERLLTRYLDEFTEATFSGNGYFANGLGSVSLEGFTNGFPRHDSNLNEVGGSGSTLIRWKRAQGTADPSPVDNGGGWQTLNGFGPTNIGNAIIRLSILVADGTTFPSTGHFIRGYINDGAGNIVMTHEQEITTAGDQAIDMARIGTPTLAGQQIIYFVFEGPGTTQWTPSVEYLGVASSASLSNPTIAIATRRTFSSPGNGAPTDTTQFVSSTYEGIRSGAAALVNPTPRYTNVTNYATVTTPSWNVTENASGDLTITLRSDTTKGMKLDASGNLTITGTLTQSGTL